MKKPTVLLLCRHNSGRSKLAEAILKHLAGDRYRVISAGFEPRPVHPLVATVLDEQGIRSSGLTSKSMDVYLGHAVIDWIITVCDSVEKYCPKLEPFALQVERWPLPDPADEPGGPARQLEAFRKTRDDLTQRLRTWLLKA
jgi:arsenate reductase (thioredoxin)